jgi:hypothetical protein
MKTGGYLKKVKGRFKGFVCKDCCAKFSPQPSEQNFLNVYKGRISLLRMSTEFFNKQENKNEKCTECGKRFL